MKGADSTRFAAAFVLGVVLGTVAVLLFRSGAAGGGSARRIAPWRGRR